MMMSINNNGVDVYTPKPSATPYNRGVPPSAQQDTYGAPQRPLTPLGQSVFAPDASTASIISRLSAQVQSIQAQLDGIQAQQLLGQGAIGQAFSSFFGNLRRFILGGKDQTDDEEIDIERERFEQKDARELFAKDRVAKPAGTELK
jgi:hypothetical protein